METEEPKPGSGVGHDGQDEEPATDKQLGYLKSLGVEIPENLEKRKASELIDAALAKQERQQ